MSYRQTIKYLETFVNYEKVPAYPYRESLKLERVGDFLAAIGNPQESLRCVHVAGTKGKGSTCAFLTYILREAGYKAGLYTSPHLSDFRERIRILGRQSVKASKRQAEDEFEGMISPDDLTGLVKKLAPAIEKCNKVSPYGPLTFFEIYTALAFLYFKEKKTDIVVLETGLGGRLDATNTASAYVCALTPISYEHTQKLGNSLREIAAEKAGIIKNKNLTVISAAQEEEAMEAIRDKCRQTGAKLYVVGRDIKYEKSAGGFKVTGMSAEYPDLKIRLLGAHQVANAALAVGVIDALRPYGIEVDSGSIRRGLYNTLWPGRCEVISENPLTIVDGAQNTASSAALREAIGENFPDKRIILVLGVSDDKDIKGICAELESLSNEVILTRADSPRAMQPERLAGYFKGKLIHLTDSVREAKSLAYSITAENELVLVTGSLFVVGEFRDDKKRY